MMHHARPHPHPRGTALILALLVSVVVTGLILTIAWAAAIQHQITSSQTHLTSAYYLAEGVAHRALWRYNHDSTYRAPASAPLTGSLVLANTTYSYSVTCVDASAASTTGAVAKWAYSEGSGSTTADSIGSNNATLTSTSWITGRSSGFALSFNGSSSYANAGSNSSLNISGPVSVAASSSCPWAHPNARISGTHLVNRSPAATSIRKNAFDTCPGNSTRSMVSADGEAQHRAGDVTRYSRHASGRSP